MRRACARAQSLFTAPSSALSFPFVPASYEEVKRLRDVIREGFVPPPAARGRYKVGGTAKLALLADLYYPAFTSALAMRAKL